MLIESLKALFVVFVMCAGAFVFARIAYREHLDPKIIDRWRNVFLMATIAAFIIPNYWAFLFVFGVLAAAAAVRDPVRPAIYLLLLFAVPAAGERVPGFAGINNFLALAPFNILALAVLFPILFAGSQTRKQRGVGALADFCFLAFSVLSLALAFRDTTMTDGIRRFAAYVLTAFGPYIVFSRYYWSKDNLKIATLACAIPLIALSGVGLAETVLSWHMYANAVDNWNISFFTRYLERSGYLRAYASVFGPITFGLFLTIGFSLALAVMASSKRRLFPMIGVMAVAVGLIVTFSRGPWIGAAFAAFIFAATVDKPLTGLMRFAGAGFLAAIVLLMTPMGPKLIGMLPFIGEVESNTISYRQRLFDVGWPYVMKFPYFGSDDYLLAPELQGLVQGQGIIDIVNAYLQVALDKGLVGLALFLGVSGFAALNGLNAIKRARAVDPEYAVYVQGWVAALFGAMLTLATTTNVVAQIAEVHWLLCGVCVGAARSVRLAAEQKAAGVGEEDAGLPTPPKSPVSPPRAAGPAAENLPPHLRQYAKRRT
ncbi:MAG TPA: O-antigen ligase family protein [Parvularculaceae bacterium]|nr:O-antigen ligase family protein [Parvularculaceae bacterium]